MSAGVMPDIHYHQQTQSLANLDGGVKIDLAVSTFVTLLGCVDVGKGINYIPMANDVSVHVIQETVVVITTVQIKEMAPCVLVLLNIY